MKKNILICTDSMGIGGVETAIYNQIYAMIKKGHNVVLASKDGIYIEKVKSTGATFVNFDFSLENNFNFEKINEMINIIEKYEINEIHVEKFMCILTMFPVCIIKKIPYVAYSHDGLNSSYEWYIYNYDIYNMLFKQFFKYANKIIAIKQSVIDYTSERFSIDKRKYKLINNCINFDECKCSNQVKNIDKFLIISRLNSEKEQSIKNAIDFFITFCKNTNKRAHLAILGSGNITEKIKEYVKTVNIYGFDIIFLGETSDVCKVIDNYNIVLGIGRCIIEAIAMKRIAIVSGYEEIVSVVTQDNFFDMLSTNFTGSGLRYEKIEELVNKINQITESQIEEIVNKNYELAFNNINIDNNIYIMDENEKSLISRPDLINQMIILQNRYVEKKSESEDFEKKVYELREVCNNQYNEIKKAYDIIDENQKIAAERQKIEDEKYEKLNEENELLKRKNQDLEIKNENLNKENENNKNQLNCIYNSKKWKFLNKIFKIYNK